MLVTQLCPALCNPMDYIPPGSSVHGINSPGMNIRVDRHSILQGIFLTQGSSLGPLHCRQILYHLSHKRILKSYLTDSQTSWRKCCQCSIETLSLLTSALYPLFSYNPLAGISVRFLSLLSLAILTAIALAKIWSPS